VRITVQLVHAGSDTHLWAESYERDMHNILALQAEVSRAIANEIQVRLTPGEQAAFARTPVVDPQAYDACLRGRYYWDKRTPAAVALAIRAFEEALARDPGFAAARAGLAECFGVLGWWSYVPPREGCAKAKALALRTLETDPNLAEAHSALAWAVQHHDYDFVAAEREFRRAIELDPRYAVAHYRFAMMLAHLGRFEEATAQCASALSLDPLSYTANATMCWVYWIARRFDSLLEHGRRTVELHPDIPHSHWPLGFAYVELGEPEAGIPEMRLAVELGGATLFRALLAETCALAGRRDEAQEILQQLQQHANEQYVTPYMFARIYTALGNPDEAFRWLNIAYGERAPWMVLLKRDPRLDRLRADPRYGPLLRLMNFPS
jgi:tetratricopeptide (TPR) repeat protein